MGEICQAFIKRACHIFLIRLEMIILTKGKFSDLHFFDSLMDIHIKYYCSIRRIPCCEDMKISSEMLY